MRYYTEFEISYATKDEEEAKAITAAGTKISEPLETILEEGYITAKWYDHDRDMIKLSKQFPEIVFRLKGLGESSDDMYMIYYNQGKMQFALAEISYRAFNPALLVELVEEEKDASNYQVRL